MRRVLVIGAGGLVGSYLHRECLRHWATAGTCRRSVPGLHPLDIRNAGAVLSVLQTFEPEIVFLAAALTSVDFCETHPADSEAVNVGGVRNVIDAAADVGASVVFFSSDYVFDGADGPYAEDAAPNPVNVYGRHKLQAEELVMKASASHLVVRTSWVYGWEPAGRNFVMRLCRALAEGRQVPVPADQYGTPTYALYLANAVVRLVRKEAAGLVHVAGDGPVPRNEFAAAAARIFGLNAAGIVVTRTSELGQTAPRPLRGGLRSEPMCRMTGLPVWSGEQGLAHMRSHRPEPTARTEQGNPGAT